MKDRLEKALRQIPLPDNLESEVLKGVDRAASERSNFMTRSVMKKVAAAAALIVIAAAGFGIYSLNRAPKIPSDAVYRFMGYEPGTDEPVIVALSSEGNMLGRVDSDGVVLKDENGETVGPDDVFIMLAYWMDENDELQFTDIPFGAYLVESNDGKEMYKLEGFNADDFGDQVMFSPVGSYLGSVEAGTAYDVKEGELKISLKKTADNSWQFEFTPEDNKKYPFSEVAEYHLDSFLGFTDEPKSLGGSAPSFLSDAEHDWMKMDDKYDGEECVWEIDMAENSLKITGAEKEVKGWVKLSSVGVTLKNGKKLELHGNWIIKVNN